LLFHPGNSRYGKRENVQYLRLEKFILPFWKSRFPGTGRKRKTSMESFLPGLEKFSSVFRLGKILFRFPAWKKLSSRLIKKDENQNKKFFLPIRENVHGKLSSGLGEKKTKKYFSLFSSVWKKREEKKRENGLGKILSSRLGKILFRFCGRKIFGPTGKIFG